MGRKTEQRRRVSADDVRNNAKEGSGGKVFFRLPKDVRAWEPKKANTYNIDIVPYVISSTNHPDKHDAGMMWYKLPFITFRSVGSSGQTIVSPATFGDPCPLMEELTRLKQNWDANEVKIKAMGLQKYVAFAVIDPDDKDRIAVFSMSYGKFFGAKAGLEKELAEGGDENLNFWDVTDAGRTLVCRFSDATYDGSNYVECTRIDFRPRPAMNEDVIMAKVPDLDAALKAMILPYDKLKKLMLAIEDKPAAGAAPATSASTPAPRSATPTPTPAAAATAVKWKEGDRVTWGGGLLGTVDDVDDDDITVKGDDGKEYEVDADDLTTAPATGQTAATPDAPVFAVGDEVQKDDGSFRGTITKIKADTATVKDASGTKQVIDLDDLELATEPPVSVVGTGDLKVGEMVKDTSDNTTGVIQKIDGDDVTIKDAKGAISIVDLDDLERISPTGATAPAATAPDKINFLVGSRVTWDDGDEEGVIVKFATKGDKVTVKDAKGVEHKLNVSDIAAAAAAPATAAPAAAKPLVVGGRCSYDDGDFEGVIVKIKPDKIKVKGDDGAESWQPIAEVVAM